MTSTSALPLLLSVGLLGGAVLTSYVVVLGNVGGRFPLPSSPAPPSSSYWQSPYWLSLPPSTAQGITLLQVAAAGGSVDVISILNINIMMKIMNTKNVTRMYVR